MNDVMIFIAIVSGIALLILGVMIVLALCIAAKIGDDEMERLMKGEEEDGRGKMD